MLKVILQDHTYQTLLQSFQKWRVQNVFTIAAINDPIVAKGVI